MTCFTPVEAGGNHKRIKVSEGPIITRLSGMDLHVSSLSETNFRSRILATRRLTLIPSRHKCLRLAAFFAVGRAV